MPETALHAFAGAHRRVLARLYAASGAARWEVSADAFSAALHESVARRFPGGASAAEIARYLETLHVSDLALAQACREGREEAWDHFVLELRPAIYAAARSVAGDDYRELADSLYAELFGLAGPDGSRRSLLAYFHGRSRLTTWLRSVLVQRHIDARRAAARTDQLDAADGEGRVPDVLVARPVANPGRAHAVAAVQAALDAAVAALDARTRLRLRLYYGEELTLAQIGRLLGEHEATVSRKLERARRDLKRAVEQHLRAEHGLSEAAIADCFEHAADAPELHLTRLLSRAEDG